MTDGCGFIAADLARQIPYGIEKVIDKDSSPATTFVAEEERSSDHPLPAIIQMRLISPVGLFKGCLLVTSNESLCKPGCVVLRESMQKDKRKVDKNSSAMDEIFHMDIVSTFERTTERVNDII